MVLCLRTFITYYYHYYYYYYYYNYYYYDLLAHSLTHVITYLVLATSY